MMLADTKRFGRSGMGDEGSGAIYERVPFRVLTRVLCTGAKSIAFSTPYSRYAIA